MTKKETYLTCPNINIFEGMTSISAIIQNYEQSKNRKRTIVRVLVDRQKAKCKARELAFLRKKSEQLGFEVILVDGTEIEDKTTGNTHGGIIAECEPNPLPSLLEHTDRIVSCGIYVMLDGIEDPYNFGYSVRSIYAAGADGIIVPHRNWMDVAGIVSKSSAGASELIDMYVAEPQEALDYFKALGYTIVCSGIRDSVSMYEADLRKPVLLIVGGEKRGISAAVEKKADIVTRIEYGRDFRGSLSAASAATIMIYEVYRQNRKNNS